MSSKVFFDDFHGESGSEFRVYSPNGDNLFGVQYSPTVYTSSNSRFAYRITLRDPYGVCGTYDFEHRMANVVYVKPSAGGTISVSGALWSGETGSGSSLRSVALCYEQGCSLTARAGAGYQFEGWYSDSGYTQRLSTSATYVFRPQKARTELYARFKAEAIPLDEDGTANCYIAPKLRTFYSFDATVQGNGKTTTNIRPQRLNGTSAILIWETGTERNAIISDVSFADGRITFTTGSKRGNAVIGLLDSRGDCIWSWHIWSVDYDIESSGQTYFSGKTFMDRNLGALTTDCTQPSSRGMYYQWGRKDPFIYPANNQDTRKFADAVYASGYEYGESYPDTSSDPESMMSISWATAHPTTYMNGAFYSDWDDRTTIIDWLYDSSPNLWGNPTTSSNTVTATSTKSIYDPCPPGWKTPSPQDLKGIQYVGRFQPNYVTIQYNSGRTTQIPMGGTLSEGYFMSNGQIGRLYTNVPYYYRWESGTSVYSERACTSLFFSSSMGTTDYYRYAANPVRCVRE